MPERLTENKATELEELLKGLEVTPIGSYLVINDGQGRWVADARDITRVVLHRVRRQEENEGEQINGYDILCQEVAPIENEKVLDNLKVMYGECVSTFR